MGRLFVVGSLNVDQVIPVERHPAPGETVLGGDAQTFWGGKGANQAVAAARAARAARVATADSDAAAEARRVVFVGRVGDDDSGRAYRERLDALGVDVTPLLVTHAVPTGSAVIAVSGTGENTIIVSSGANAHLSVDDLSALVDLRADDVVVLTLEVPLPVVVRASELAERAGARFVLNLSPVAQVPAEVVHRAHPVVVNEHEAEALHEQFGALPSVLITRGSAGSEWNGNVVPAVTGIRVVDTTGAGDAYCGTFAFALAVGASDREAMRVATEAAADVVARPGAQ